MLAKQLIIKDLYMTGSACRLLQEVLAKVEPLPLFTNFLFEESEGCVVRPLKDEDRERMHGIRTS